MLRTLVAFLCFCFAPPTSAKLGETVPQLVKRFGKNYTVEEAQLEKTYKFRSANVSVDVVVSNGRSLCETYFSDHPLTASGEPPNDIVRAVLRTNVPKTRWVEIEAAPLGADYAMRSSDGEYVAILKYTGPQPENMIWTMTIGLEKSVQAVSTAAPSSNPSSPTAPVAESPLPTPSPPVVAPKEEAWPGEVLEFETGVRFYTGNGQAKNFSKAVEWFRKAAEKNDARAQFFLGLCCQNGEGVPKNYAEAVKWYRRAAEQNFDVAQYNLAVCYNNGQGVRKNYVEAAKWYRRAAEQNYDVAQFALGSCYETGEGVPKNYAEAVKWYRRAAEQNHSFAQLRLALCYCYGWGVPKDYVECYKWILIVGAQDESARKATTTLENRMSREQIAEGQKLAREFKPREAPPTGADSSAPAIAQTRPKSSGTGFFITEDGYLITNEHVAGNTARVRLVTASGLIPAKVVNVDAANDLALLKAEGKYEALPVAASRAAKLGSTVVTVGFPNIGLQGFAPKFARGEIASLSGPQDDPRFFQISVPLQPGNSGGALVDEHGNVIGVVSAKLSAEAALKASGALPENVNYAVKSSFLLGFLESAPDVVAKLKEPNAKDTKFDDVVEQAKEAAALVVVY
jgi:tetratricopeptide (TPR) repeat protein